MSLTLKETITATQTTIDVNGADALTNGDLYTIEDEQVFIVTASAGNTQPGETAWQRLNVQRGQLGTTEVAHTAGTAVTAVTVPLGAGGVVTILQTTLTLTDAQIKALPTTPVAVLAAGGAGTIIHPVAAVLYLDWTADYANVDGTAFLAIEYASSFESALGRLEETDYASVSELLGMGEDAVARMPPYGQSSGNFNMIGSTRAAADIVNQGLSIRISNGVAGALTGGNAANTLKVNVLYAVIEPA